MPSAPKNAKKPQDHKSATPTFGRRSQFTLDLPSGSSIEVQRPGIQGLIKAGLLDSLDSLTGIVQQTTIPKAEGRPEVDIKKLTENPGQVESMMELMDKIVVHVVVEPAILWPYVPEKTAAGEPIPGKFEIGENGKPVPLADEDREPDAAYIDWVEDNDKSFIMQFALGGSADLVAFREATKEAMGGVQPQ